jgi:hypothetical protein
MTNFSRIEMAFELYKQIITNGNYYNVFTDDDYRLRNTVKLSFKLADAFIEETKHQGNK